MFKNLILIENQKSYQFSSEKEVVEYLLGANYYNATKEEQLNQMEMNGLLNCAGTDVKVINLENVDVKNINITKKFIIYDEKTYILSLLLLNKIMLLESVNSNIFTNKLDKTNIKDNYIIVNTFANELLEKYIKDK